MGNPDEPVRAARDGVHPAVEVADVDADVAEGISEFLGGAPGEGGNEDTLLPLDALPGFFDEVDGWAGETESEEKFRLAPQTASSLRL
jgi:hypothetical protein